MKIFVGISVDMDSGYSRHITCNHILYKYKNETTIKNEEKFINDINNLFNILNKFNMFKCTTIFVNEPESQISEYHYELLKQFTDKGCEIGLHSHLNHPYSFNSNNICEVSNNFEDYIGNGILIPKHNLELFLKKSNSNQKYIYSFKAGNHVISNNVLYQLIKYNFLIDTSYIYETSAITNIDNVKYYFYDYKNICFENSLFMINNILEIPETLPNLYCVKKYINECTKNNKDCYLRFQVHQWDYKVLNVFLDELICYFKSNNLNYEQKNIYEMYNNYMLNNNLELKLPVETNLYFSETINHLSKLGDINDFKINSFVEDNNVKFKLLSVNNKKCFVYLMPYLEFIKKNSSNNIDIDRKIYKIKINFKSEHVINKIKYFNGEFDCFIDINSSEGNYEISTIINYYNLNNDNYPHLEFIYDEKYKENTIIINNIEIISDNLNINDYNMVLCNYLKSIINSINIAIYYGSRINNNFILDNLDIFAIEYITSNFEKNISLMEGFAGIGQVSHILNLLGYKNCKINDIDISRIEVSNQINKYFNNNNTIINDTFENINFENIDLVFSINCAGIYGINNDLIKNKIKQIINYGTKILLKQTHKEVNNPLYYTDFFNICNDVVINENFCKKQINNYFYIFYK